VAVFRSSTDENKFTLVEAWESKELHQATVDKLTGDGTWDMIISHLSAEPTTDYFDEI
jgi:quinol monooxygenase YgiN